MCNSPVQLSDQHDANAENHTQLPHNAHFMIRTKPKRPTAQPEDNSENIDNTNSPRPQKSKGKASHPDKIKG